jgi:hypothetical protein
MKLQEFADWFYKLAEEPNDDILLPPNERQKEWAVDGKVNWVVDIDPKIFLQLTLSTDPGWYPRMETIDPQPLSFYQSKEIQSDLSVHPFLKIDKNTGKVVGHEGRHRAAAVMKAGGKWYRIGIQFSETSRNHRPEGMPTTWLAQYASYTVSVAGLINSGKMRIIDQHIQKQYYR